MHQHHHHHNTHHGRHGVHHRFNMRTVLATLVLLAASQTIVRAIDICATPSALQNSTPTSPDSSQTCGEIQQQFASASYTANQCSDPLPGSSGGTTLRGFLWYMAGACCSDYVPNPLCGDYVTICNQTSQLEGSVSPPSGDDGNGSALTCAVNSPAIMSGIADGVSCSANYSDSGTTYEEMISRLAVYCCEGGVANQSWHCSEPPVIGSVCADPDDFVDDAQVGLFRTSCANVQGYLLSVDFYRDNATCAETVPDSGSALSYAGAFHAAADACCNGQAASDFCGPAVSPCASPSLFQPDVNMSFGGPQDEPQSCRNFQYAFTGLNASSCSSPWSSDDVHNTVARVLLAVGSTCCSNGNVNLMCGSMAPTPPPSPPPPRVGPTYACGGHFDVRFLGNPGSFECSGGNPFMNVTLPGICSTYQVPGDNGNMVTEHGFFLSNGGICAGFLTPTDCADAVANLNDIVDGRNVSQVTTGNTGRCWLSQDTCIWDYSQGVSIHLTNLQCGPPPNITLGTMCLDPHDIVPTRMYSGSTTCAQMNTTFHNIDLFGHPSLCNATASPLSSSFTWGAVLATAAATCCDGPMASTCSDGRVLPCASASDFLPSNNVSFNPSTSVPCSQTVAALYGANTSSCQSAFAGSLSTLAQILAFEGRDCCTGGRMNEMCGTLPPTPPPTAFTRVGATTACAGTVDSYYVTAPQASTCVGTPSLATTFATPCAAATSQAGSGQHGFVISNGGLCVGFNSTQDCMLAANALADLVAGNTVVANVVTHSPNAQCFFGPPTTCNYLEAPLVFAKATPGTTCVAPPNNPTPTPTFAPTAMPTSAAPTGPTMQPTMAPTASPTAPTAAPTLAPTVSPTAPTAAPTGVPTTTPTASPTPTATSDASSDDAIGTGVIVGIVVVVGVVVLLIVAVVGAKVMAPKKKERQAPSRNQMINPTYEG